MIRPAAMLLLLAGAPLQCPAARGPETAREESAAEALWTLSERFAAQGDARAQAVTLDMLIERHPSSRFAERARLLRRDAGAR